MGSIAASGLFHAKQMGNSQTKSSGDCFELEAMELEIVKRNIKYSEMIQNLVQDIPVNNPPEMERSKSSGSTGSDSNIASSKESSSLKFSKPRPTSRIMTRLAPLNTSTLSEGKQLKESENSPVSPNSIQILVILQQLGTFLHMRNYLPTWLSSYIPPNDRDSIKRSMSKIYETLGDLERERLAGSDYTFKVASNPVNKLLNRYSDILPFDQCRIILASTEDYINATRLISPVFKPQYISTQGPLPQTFGDFWHMVWEEACPVIVMLTKEEDSGRLKCHKYWPEKGETGRYSKDTQTDSINFKIFNSDTTELMDSQIVVREFAVKRECRPLKDEELDVSLEIRKVKLLQFLDWSDHSPCNPRSLLTVLDIANQIRSQKPEDWIIHSDTNILSELGPMIVHCSAGVGRTAVFCTVDTVLSILVNQSSGKISKNEQLPADDLVALTVNHFRSQRPGAIQSRAQLQLCYDAVLLRLGDWFLEGKSPEWPTLKFDNALIEEQNGNNLWPFKIDIH